MSNTDVVKKSTYPAAWEEQILLSKSQPVVIRPIRPEDAALYKEFMAHNTFDDIRHRFFGGMRQLSDELVKKLTHVDYKNTMAFVVLDQKSGDLLGVSRYALDKNEPRAECTVMTRSDFQGKGIGYKAVQTLMAYAKQQGIAGLWIEVMRDNTEMLELCRDLGFNLSKDEANEYCLIATYNIK